MPFWYIFFSIGRKPVISPSSGQNNRNNWYLRLAFPRQSRLLIPLGVTLTFKYLTQLDSCLQHVKPSFHRLQVRGKMPCVITNQSKSKRTTNVLWCLSAELSRPFPHNWIWSLSSEPARHLAAESPQFHCSLHADLIIHKASNYTSIKHANKKTGINRSGDMVQVHYWKHAQVVWNKTLGLEWSASLPICHDTWVQIRYVLRFSKSIATHY